MKLKDKLGNQVEIYQDKEGGIQLLFGHNSIRLQDWQIKALFETQLRDIEDFDEKLFKEFYPNF